VDSAGRQPDAVDPKHDLVVLDAELDLLGPARNSPELLEGTRRDDRLEIGDLAFEWRLLHRQAVGVGRGHDQLAGLEASEDAGQHGPGLVARRSPTDPRDRFEQWLGL